MQTKQERTNTKDKRIIFKRNFTYNCFYLTKTIKANYKYAFHCCCLKFKKK